MYGVSTRQVERWSADPDTTESHARNPIDRYETLLKKLIERGEDEIAAIAVARQARLLGCELSACDAVVTPNGVSVEDECLDDYPALTRFHTAIREKADPEQVLHLCTSAKKDIDETMELYFRRLYVHPGVKKGKGD